MKAREVVFWVLCVIVGLALGLWFEHMRQKVALVRTRRIEQLEKRVELLEDKVDG
jgi:hypothetical protein